MPSLISDFEYDIFISYRQNDNRSGWVTAFVKDLNEELAATVKEPISVYFDNNPHDGLQDTHNVGKSLEGKLKCLIFIPILSHTYCDTKCFAWNKEFLVFCEMAKTQTMGLDVRLQNGNYASRVLPIQIHDLNSNDRALFENVTGSQLRSIEFIFKMQGVNRSLTPDDARSENYNKTLYRDQINKTANAIEQIIEGVKSADLDSVTATHIESSTKEPVQRHQRIWDGLQRRNVLRAIFVYVLVALILQQTLAILIPNLNLDENYLNIFRWALIGGFIVAAIFAWLYEFSPQGIIRISSPHSKTNPFPANRKKPFTSTPLVIILLLALIVQYIYYGNKQSTGIAQRYVNADSTISIVVLPFENRSDHDGDKYIANGITDDIVNQLASIRKFKVIYQGRSPQKEASIVSLEDVVRFLDVELFVTGSLERLDDNIIIRARLLDKNNISLWGNTFQRTTQNIMAVQSEIAFVIADQLKVQLNDNEKNRLNKQVTNNATAYDYYLRGREYYYKYKPSANDSAITQFKLATSLDPNYARAWAGLGDAFAQRYGRFAREYFWTDSGLNASKRAIQLDSGLADGYKAMAASYNYREDYEKALPLLLKSLELNPSNEQAMGNLGTTYLLKGELVEALRWEKKSVGMNPKNWIPYQLIGWIYRLLGDLSQAESWLLESLELNPKEHDTYELLGYTYVSQGRKQEALNLIPRLLEIGENKSRVFEVAGLLSHFAGDVRNAKKYFQQSIEKNENYKEDHYTVSPIGLGQILLQEGNHVEAEVYLSHAIENSLSEIEIGSKSFEPPFYIASVYAIRGNKEKSLEWLQKAIDANWVDFAKFQYGPYFEKFRNDPDFNKKINQVRQKVEAMFAKTKDN